jgi:hypothetical protein
MTRLLTLLFGAALAVSPFGATSVNAQTVTISGCASFTTSAQTSSNITITCNQATTQPGAPSCSGLAVNPPSDANSPTSVALTANCTPGSNPITSYTFKAGGSTLATQGSNALTLTPAPTATTTYSVTASDGSLSSNTVSGSFTKGGVIGAVDLSACTAQGLNGRLMDLTYSTSGNIRLSSDSFGNFGNSDAIVLRFTTTSVVGDTAGVQFSQIAGTPQVFRVATLSTQPCQVATTSGASGSILASSYSKSPVFYLAVGASYLGKVKLDPSTTYYVTVVNRNGYGGTNSCTSSSCGVFMDFTN